MVDETGHAGGQLRLQPLAGCPHLRQRVLDRAREAPVEGERQVALDRLRGGHHRRQRVVSRAGEEDRHDSREHGRDEHQDGEGDAS